MSYVPRPSLILNFAELSGILDPRATFSRASTATYYDRMGVLKTAPANVPRWRWNPADGSAQGYLGEGSRTNLLLRSEALDNASWTKTSSSISADAVAAPDGATTADTITVSGASGNANQAITITAGNGITASAFFKQKTSAYGRLRISDGTNSVAAWFNIATGTVGTASVGGSTCAYSTHGIEDVGGGWYRCYVTVTTATNTAYTVYVSCAAADNTEPAAADDVYAWGLQAESPGTTASMTAYIPTTSATVTRSADMLAVPIGTSWFSSTEGSMLIEFVERVGTFDQVLGGIGDTFNNTVYAYRQSASSIRVAVLSGGVAQAGLSATKTQTVGNRVKVAFAWKANDFQMSIDGATPITDSSGAVPASTSRIVAGSGPWSASATSVANVPIRRLLYWPRHLGGAGLQTISQ